MLYVVMHSSCEDGQTLLEWAEEENMPACRVRLYAGEELPVLATGDRVVLMGGWMSVTEVEEYPWLLLEKEWLAGVLAEDKIPVLGICLGAQLMTEVLGGTVVVKGRRRSGLSGFCRSRRRMRIGY